MSDLTWEVTIGEPDPNGDCWITIPQEIIDELGWQPGDTLVWCIEDGDVTLRKMTGENHVD
jgi:hypothetical protein